MVTKRGSGIVNVSLESGAQPAPLPRPRTSHGRLPVPKGESQVGKLQRSLGSMILGKVGAKAKIQRSDKIHARPTASALPEGGSRLAGRARVASCSV